jgi:nickel superoxide dismutase
MKKKLSALVLLAAIFALTTKTYAHCEVPCGIFDDQLRIMFIKEHIVTIEKSMNQIKELEKESPVNYNQIVRWVNTKEMHAKEIQHVAEQYFMAQRIKPADPSDEDAYKKYISQLTLMHELMIYAMKSKQSLDQEWIDKMRDTVEKFEVAYFGKKLEEMHTH